MVVKRNDDTFLNELIRLARCRRACVCANVVRTRGTRNLNGALIARTHAHMAVAIYVTFDNSNLKNSLPWRGRKTRFTRSGKSPARTFSFSR